MRVLVIVAAALALASTSVHAQLYRWVDQDGKVNYTQQPPPIGAKNVQKKATGSAPPESTALPYATQIAAKNYPVVLYTTPECGEACVQARNALVSRTVPFREVSVAEQKGADELKNMGGKAEVPVLRVGTQMQSGFEAAAYKNALDAAGYPASGPRLPISALRKEDAKPVPAKGAAEGTAQADPASGSAPVPVPVAKQ